LILINHANDKIDRALTFFLEENSPQFLKAMHEKFKSDFCELPDMNLKIQLPSKVLDFALDLLYDPAKELYCFDRSHYKKITKLVYKPIPETPKDLICEKNLGSAHRNTKKPPKDGYDSHHMPPKSAYYGSNMYPLGAKTSNDGPAIKITAEDHIKTSSYGSRQKAQEYRAMQKSLVQESRFYEALQNDIDDLRKIAVDNGNPIKYECQIQQVIEYANTLDPRDFIINKGLF
jgi:hypothetical protein